MAEDQLIETDRPHQEMSGQLGDPTKTLKQPQVTPSKSQHRMLAAEASSGETKATPLQALWALLWQGSTRKVQQMAFAKGGIVVPPTRGLLFVTSPSVCQVTGTSLCIYPLTPPQEQHGWRAGLSFPVPANTWDHATALSFSYICCFFFFSHKHCGKSTERGISVATAVDLLLTTEQLQTHSFIHSIFFFFSKNIWHAYSVPYTFFPGH